MSNVGTKNSKVVTKLSRPPTSGLLFALVAPTIYGAGIPLSKVLLDHAGSWLLAGLLQFGAGIGMSVLYLVRPRGTAPALKGKDWPRFALSLVMGGVFASVLMMVGLRGTTAATASLLLNLEGVSTATIAWVLFRERFSTRLAAGLFVITAGGALLCLRGDSAPVQISWASLALVGACLCWGVAANIGQPISNCDPVQMVALRGLIAGGGNILLALLLGERCTSWQAILLAAVAGLVTDGVAVLCYTIAQSKIGTSRTATFFALAPLVGASVAIFVLKETPTTNLLVAGGFMLLGLGVCLSEKRILV
jgi:drug/metabolite transporter (DMT)-like permease